MTDPKLFAQQFLAALIAHEATCWDALLTEDVGLRLHGTPLSEIYRPRARVARRLLDESARWTDARVELIALVAEGERLAIQFRIQATEDDRYIEHNRAAFVTMRDDRAQVIDLYASAPLPSGHREKDWIAPADLTEEQINRLFDSMQYAWDTFEWIPPDVGGIQGLTISRWGSGDAHPGSNGVSSVRWSAEEADAKIQVVIEYHRARNIGFCWFVNPFDTPKDLRARLEKHGLVFAGDQAVMARIGLNARDIPVNPDLRIEVLDGSRDDLIEHALQICGRCFNWTQEQIDQRRPAWLERARHAEFRKTEVQYLGWLGETPVANARVVFRSGIAYLGGASTLPEFRSRKVYSSLLRRRLEDAHARGYHIAAIHAEPMSRRVVSRYGFREYAKAYLYGWMPVIDLQVIKSLVPDE